MGKISTGKKTAKKNDDRVDLSKQPIKNVINNNYIFKMGSAPDVSESTHWFQMLPIAFFTSFVIIITRMAAYERPMEQFFWSGGNPQLTDFFSYYKMTAILICAFFAVILISYRVFTQTLYIKRSYAYLPIIIYSILVVLSYIFSDYQLFALWGWNDRFEGTLTLLAYMVMLFFTINSMNTEKNVKWIIYPLAISSFLLGLLGLSQALGHDFFRTAFGKKLITPSWFWDQVDTLNFTFQRNEIYQTVYNINYVSFYLTLLIPLFGMLFIKSMLNDKKEEALWKKISWGALFTLLLFNLIGSASSGGLLGMAVVLVMGIIVLNKKILQWWKPVIVLLVLTILVVGVTNQRWLPELSSAIKGVSVNQSEQLNANSKIKIDYIKVKGQSILLSVENNEISFVTFPDNPTHIKALDANLNPLPLIPADISTFFRVDDDRFEGLTVRYAQDDAQNNFIAIGTDGYEWPFLISSEGPKYLSGLGKLVELQRVPSFGWENNGSWGNGRGYIWSRSIPMVKDTLFLGHGADTYCIYFPHDDYVGKYNSGSFSSSINIVVDKPHNMYLGMAIGTGLLSMITLLSLYLIYVVQSYLLYRKETFNTLLHFVGVGIFLGVCGFLVSALVNDSSVSVMPMFYGLLGTGLAINMIIRRKNNTEY